MNTLRLTFSVKDLNKINSSTCKDYFEMAHSCLTLTLSTDEPVAFGAGAGVAPSCVDAHLGGVTVMRVGLTLVNVCNKEEEEKERI